MAIYQSFPGKTGASRSSEKLAAIRIPASLAGKSVLDIGCNAGFFSGEAKRRGANRVVGIDNNPNSIAEARRRFPECEFVCGDWSQLPQGPFDLILFLSAIHYAADVQQILNAIHQRLGRNGLFILECGVFSSDDPAETWRTFHRAKDTVRHPSMRYLIRELLENFGTRHIGRSVDQSGDPLARHAFHCRPYQRVCVIFSGRPGDGKTVLSREFDRQGIPIVSADAILRSLGYDALALGSTLESSSTDQLKAIGEAIGYAMVERKGRVIVAEGYAFEFPPVYREVHRILQSAGCQAWRAGKMSLNRLADS